MLKIIVIARVFLYHQLGLNIARINRVGHVVTVHPLPFLRRISSRHRSLREHFNVDDAILVLSLASVSLVLSRCHSNFVLLLHISPSVLIRVMHRRSWSLRSSVKGPNSTNIDTALGRLGVSRHTSLSSDPFHSCLPSGLVKSAETLHRSHLGVSHDVQVQARLGLVRALIRRGRHHVGATEERGIAA